MIAALLLALAAPVVTLNGMPVAVAVAPDAAGLLAVPVAEGNYRVTVTLGDRTRAAVTTIKAESRRLMLDRVATAKGQTVTRRFVVNVRNAQLAPPPATAPGGTMVRLKDRERTSFTWDDALTLELLGNPAVTRIAIDPVTVPTIYLAGDSTVTDQPSEPAASWGQMLPALFDDGIAIANHAESGETLKSFVTELRLDKILGQIRPGDYLLVQFGHNDQKVQWPQTYADAATTYRAWLRTYAAEARRRGALPVFVTSPERRTFGFDGRIRSTLADYAAAVRAVGTELGVPVIDLNRMSATFYEALGPARAPLAFNDGGKDATHHNNYGAYQLARMVADGIRTAGLPVAAHLLPSLSRPDPAHPDAPERFALPPSHARSDVRPTGN